MNDLTKNLLLWVVVAVVLMVVFQSFSPKGGATATGGPITYSEFLREVDRALYRAKAGGRDRSVHVAAAFADAALPA